jgi:hypothetical protein
MNEERKKIILITVLSAILLLLIIFIIWWFLRPKTEPEVMLQPEEEALTELPQIEVPVVPQSAEAPRIIQEEIQPLGLRQLAMSFAERYASYSTDEPEKNIDDLESFMTAELYEKLKNRNLTEESGSFVGFSGRALTYSVIDSDALSARIVIGMQLTQIIDTVENTFNNNLEITARKINNEWKIDDINWQ